MSNINKMVTRTQIIKQIEKNADKIRSFGVSRLILIGSYATGKQKNRSDIDFIVEFNKKRGLFDDYINLLHFLEDLFNKKIDLVEKNLIREELRSHIFGGKKIEAKI